MTCHVTRATTVEELTARPDPPKGTVTAREAGVVRTRRARAYPDGNIRDQVAACESLASLRELVAGLGRLVVAKRVSTRAIRQAQKAIDVRRRELEARHVVVPEVKGAGSGRRTRGGLYLP